MPEIPLEKQDEVVNLIPFGLHRRIAELGLDKYLSAKGLERISQCRIQINQLGFVKIILGDSSSIEPNNIEPDIVILASQIEDLINNSNIITLSNLSINREIENLYAPKYKNGIKQPLRERELIKGIGLHSVEQLLYSTGAFDSPEVSILTGVLMLMLMETLSDAQRTKVAKVVMYAVQPLLRYYEIPAILTPLRDKAFEILFPQLSGRVMKIQEDMLGAVHPDIDLQKLEDFLSDKINEAVGGFSPTASRFKDRLALLNKYVDGIPQVFDQIAVKAVVNDAGLVIDGSPQSLASQQERLDSIVALLIDAGVEIVENNNSYITPMQGDSDYKVYNLRVRLPAKIVLRDGIQFTDGLMIPCEIRLGFFAYDDTHVGFKGWEEHSPRLTEEEAKREGIGLARYLQSAVKKSDSIEPETLQIVQNVRKRCESETIVYTSKGNNALFIDAKKPLADQLMQFETQINTTSFLPNSVFVVRRFENGVFTSYIIEIDRGGIKISIREPNGATSEMRTISVPDNFKLQRYDVVTKLNYEYYRSGEFMAENTLGDILNLIAQANSVEDIPFDRIFRSFTNVSRDEIIELYYELQASNATLVDQSEDELVLQNYPNRLAANEASDNRFNRIRDKFIRVSVVNKVMQTRAADVKKDKQLRSTCKKVLLNLTSRELIEQFEAREDLEEFVLELFSFDKYDNDPGVIQVWFGILESFGSRSQRIFKILVENFLSIQQPSLDGASPLNVSTLAGLLKIFLKLNITSHNYLIKFLAALGSSGIDELIKTVMNRRENQFKQQLLEILKSRISEIKIPAHKVNLVYAYYRLATMQEG